MTRTLTVKAKDTRTPWIQLLLVALVTWLAAGCSPTASTDDSDALILSFDEETAESTPTKISQAEENGLALTFIR